MIKSILVLVFSVCDFYYVFYCLLLSIVRYEYIEFLFFNYPRTLINILFFALYPKK